jgi:hypothetical protein
LRLLVVSGCLVALALVAAGCESSQDRSARLAKQGGKAFTRKGLDVKHENPDVKVTGTTVLQDKNGAATVVDMHNAAATAELNVPVSIDVLGPGKTSVFKNDAPGLEPSLVSAPLLPAKSDFTWVNDQVTATGPARAVDVKIGRPPASSGQVPAKLPQLDISTPTLQSDPVSGVEASGTVTNKSSVEQTALIVYCVARRGKKVVAAGRSAIARLQSGKKKAYHVYFIGNPSGGKLWVAAPPTVLK